MSAVNPLAAGVPLAVAAIAFAALLRTETRRAQPLVDFGLFANRNFAIAAGLLFLVMFDIMTLLLYYNLFAQSVEGLGVSAVAAGLSLLPLSVALFAFARAAPVIAARIGMRRMLTGGSLLLALGCAIIWSSLRIEAKFARSAARPLCRRRRDCADLRLRAAARARDVAANAGGQRLGHAQFVQLSRRHGRRDLRRNRIHAGRIFRRAGAAWEFQRWPAQCSACDCGWISAR